MNNGERARLLAQFGATWQQLTQQHRDGNLHRLLHMQPGPHAATYDTDHTHPTNGITDPTSQQATHTGDQTTRDLHDLDTHITTAHHHLDRAARILANYGPPRAANDADHLALTRTNTRPEPGCQSCARTDIAPGIPRWVPPASHNRGNPVDLNGQLPEPMHLCRWCEDRVKLWARLPTTTELTLYHERGPRSVPWPKDVPHPDRNRRPA